MIIRPETPVGIEPAFAAIGIGNRVDGGRPPIEAELRALIRQMRRENSLWGAPGIHGELLELARRTARARV
jgi:hypothetical protein